MAGEITKVYRPHGGDKLVVASGGTIEMQTGSLATGRQFRNHAKSRIFNIDNGAGATIDDVVLCHSAAITITHARAVYVTEAAGTVAGANFRIGTTVGGAEIVAATAYTNSSAIGAVTAGTLVAANVPANTPVCVRHTGIATTAAGEVFIEIHYTVDG